MGWRKKVTLIKNKIAGCEKHEPCFFTSQRSLDYTLSNIGNTSIEAPIKEITMLKKSSGNLIRGRHQMIEKKPKLNNKIRAMSKTT